MTRSRIIGIGISLIFLVGLVIIGLLRDGGVPGPPPDLRNGRIFIQDNLWSAGTDQYAVWVGPDGTPYAGKRPREEGEWKVTNLAELPGNPLAAPTEDDEHNVYAIGVDATGGVHIAGNMHNDPLRYVRSRTGNLRNLRPRDGPRPGASTTYPVFVGLPDGTLLFSRREGSAGEGAILLDALAPGARSWRSRGVILDGEPTNEGPYLHHIAVDPRTGAIHLLFEWRGGATSETNNDVGYARSVDGGRSWQTSAGTTLDAPITHATAETVIDTNPSGSGLLNGGGLTVDTAGRPHAAVGFQRADGSQLVEHLWLDDGTWQREQHSDRFLTGRPQIAATHDGRVWLLAVNEGDVEAIDVTPDTERLGSSEIVAVPPKWEVAYDSQALARYGVVEMLVPRGDAPQVVAASLPNGNE